MVVRLQGKAEAKGTMQQPLYKETRTERGPQIHIDPDSNESLVLCWPSGNGGRPDGALEREIQEQF